MSEHPNARLVKSFFAAQAAGDLDALVEILSEDIIWPLPRGETRLSLDRTVVGLAVLTEMGINNFQASNGTFCFNVQKVFSGDEFVSVVSHNTAQTDQRTLDVQMAIQFRLVENKIVEVWESVDDMDAFYEFWR
jgi:ketosteroid isomerase-like protein